MGDYLEYSSRIQGVIDFYGVTDFVDGFGRRQEELELDRKQFVGNGDKREVSSYLHIDEDTPPFLIFHGDRDDLVDICQSEKMYQSLIVQKIPVKFYILEGCGHGADEFYQEEILEIVADFIHEREKK